MSARLRPASFAASILIHGLILAWVASGPVHDEPPTLYKQLIAPFASKLIWYNFREKLPDVSPGAARKPAKPLRADVKLPRQIVAGSPKAPKARQFVWQPAPKLELHADLRSPNVVAMRAPAPPPKPKLFVPPPEAPKTPAETPALAPPPDVRMARNASAPGTLPGMHPEKAPPRKFVAPRERHPVAQSAPALPDAPVVAAAVPAAPAPSVLGSAATKAPPRAFVAPGEAAKRTAPQAALPDVPSLPATPSAVSMAIVGLNPASSAPAPAPEGSRNAQFSAGPQLRGKGETEASGVGAMLTVPGLLIHSGEPDTKPSLMARAAPTSAANLRAALRSSVPAASIPGAHPAAVRVASAPDPHWSGRDTYAMSVQMPNVTSYTGSWMIWFSERERSPEGGGVLNPPVPLRKVDPKYFPAAIADRVEGKVRLAAIIRKDGRVDSVRLLQHLDDRLDQSAQDALDKWQFEPALKNGQPVDVDAVVEIPFRLAPKVPK